MRRIAVLMIAGLALAACQSVTTEVIAFSKPEAQAPKTFRVADPGGSLEEQQYAEMISSRLEAKGWRRSSTPEATVSWSHSIDNGRQVTDFVPVTTLQGGGMVPVSGSVDTPSGSQNFSGVAMQPMITTTENIPVSKIIYRRTLKVAIEMASGGRIYEASATSTGETGQFFTVAGCMMDALFKDFPKGTGRVVEVTADEGKCVRR